MLAHSGNMLFQQSHITVHAPVSLLTQSANFVGAPGRDGGCYDTTIYGARHLDGAFLGKRFENSSNY